MTLWIYYARACIINTITEFMIINDSTIRRIIPAVFNDFTVSSIYERSEFLHESLYTPTDVYNIG